MWELFVESIDATKTEFTNHVEVKAAPALKMMRSDDSASCWNRRSGNRRMSSIALPADLPDRNSGGAAGGEKKVRRHIVELDTHWDALREAHPAEGWIDGGQQVAAGAAVLVFDTVSDALDVPRQQARIADQLYGRIFSDTDTPQFGFLEITLDAERVGTEQRKNSCAGIDVAPGQEIEIGDYAVDRRQDR